MMKKKPKREKIEIQVYENGSPQHLIAVQVIGGGQEFELLSTDRGRDDLLNKIDAMGLSHLDVTFNDCAWPVLVDKEYQQIKSKMLFVLLQGLQGIINTDEAQRRIDDLDKLFDALPNPDESRDRLKAEIDKMFADNNL